MFLVCFVVTLAWWLSKLIPQKISGRRKKGSSLTGQTCSVECNTAGTHTAIKKASKACLLMRSEATQNDDMFLGLSVPDCVFRSICVYRINVWKCQRADGKRKNPDWTPCQQKPDHQTSKRQKSRPSRKIKSACRHVRNTRAGRKRKLKQYKERLLVLRRC